MARFEELAQSLDRIEMAEKTDQLKSNLNSKACFFQKLQGMATEFIQLSKRSIDSLTDEEHEALELLAKDKSIVITKADKGNAVVIQDLLDYKNKISEILSKSDKFSKLKGDYTGSRENKLQTFFRDHKKLKRPISDQEYRSITPCGSKAGVLYGLPKIHKNNVPLRPIISAVNTYNYKLAKHLVKILSPLLDQTHTLKDTFDFVNKVSSLNTITDTTLVSFDVESLFTNVPTFETIEIILHQAFVNIPTNGEACFNGFTRKELKRLLILCTQESHFQFNNEFYDQVDGVSMGSPLGPLFANFFMSHFERKHMSEFKKLGINLWYRYVDDDFASLKLNANVDAILEFMNGLHKNIRFTFELEENNKLPFLETYVVRYIDKYVTTVYHKQTFTGVYLNWTSLTSRKYKIGLINCLLNRIHRICTRPEDRHIEIARLKSILHKNE